jgi:hypothetical protein
MKKVMVRAWKIAREAVAKFGGSVKEYFAQALTIAWAEAKNAIAYTQRIILTANHDKKHYVVAAEINGQIKDVYENLNNDDMIQRYNDMISKYGIKTVSYYVIKGGTRAFLETKVLV